MILHVYATLTHKQQVKIVFKLAMEIVYQISWTMEVEEA